MKAYNVQFSTVVGHGRHHGAKYKTAVVIAETAMEAGALAEKYCAAKLKGYHLVEIRLEDDLVIMKAQP